ncbi:NAD-dependent epimerase/dehydratase family protein [Streptomyces zingiberis]|uniref:NAD-dependent epimerase/dehydratase family protein n=1 Tax=Streptomyces zingiberis TaxID=2053010 RepID=A0ABX1C077_9ACTN|nr:NAD-dependent epimerase/dehydratase family protein [Streptomyces zingiberis]NJQ00304.1 NAD-dependent epimerase/dehydratase family protein [Streptomyces zingiberis]
METVTATAAATAPGPAGAPPGTAPPPAAQRPPGAGTAAGPAPAPDPGEPWRHAVVTAGSGFLGSHLCAALLARGTAVTCVDDFSTGTPENIAEFRGHPGFTLLHADVTEPFDTRRLPGETDLVLHLLTPPSPAGPPRLPPHIGGPGTRNALELARARGARFLLTSTAETHGGLRWHRRDERHRAGAHPAGPRRNRRHAEAEHTAPALTATGADLPGAGTGIVRLFPTYGPRMRGHDGPPVPTFIRQALAGEPLTVAGDGRRTHFLCHVDDAVRGILAAADADPPGPVDIGSPHAITELDLAGKIIALSGSPSTVRSAARPAGHPAARRPDLGRARGTLRWQPRVDTGDGLARTIAWYRERTAARAA